MKDQYERLTQRVRNYAEEHSSTIMLKFAFWHSGKELPEEDGLYVVLQAAEINDHHDQHPILTCRKYTTFGGWDTEWTICKDRKKHLNIYEPLEPVTELQMPFMWTVIEAIPTLEEFFQKTEED